MSTQKIIVTFDNNISDEDYKKAKEAIVEQGGEIKDDFGPLLKSFSAIIPKDLDLKADPSFEGDDIIIEQDGTVTTQD